MGAVTYAILLATVLGLGYYAVNTVVESSIEAQQRIIRIANQ